MRCETVSVIAAFVGGATGAAHAVDNALGDHQTAVSPRDPAACRVGGTPTQPYGEAPPERDRRYGTRPIVIGCATLRSGRRLELVGYQLGTRAQTRLCIDHYDVDSHVSWGCGSNRVDGGGAIGSTSTARLRGKPDLLLGTIAVGVRRVVIRSEDRGRLRRSPVSTVRVRGRRLLRAIGIDKPFGRILGEVPRGARAVTAEAFGRHRRSLGLAFFPGFRRAVGEGRACYTRPRVANMRLLDPPRRGERSRLRVVALYQRGYVSSLEAAVAGLRNDHVDFKRPLQPSDGGRVATLHVRFPRRGTVGVDAVAEGRPISSRCNTDPALRQSTMKTLVVRVR